MSNMMNRTHNSTNPYQRDFKRVLCVCSAGLLRSPTAAWVLGQEPFNYNTRACGIEPDYALIPIDEVLVSWAQEIVTMNWDMTNRIFEEYPKFTKEIVSLDILDNYPYRDPELIRLITKHYTESLERRKAKAIGVTS
jgi:predicted protein tyrosine phosphatase